MTAEQIVFKTFLLSEQKLETTSTLYKKPLLKKKLWVLSTRWNQWELHVVFHSYVVLVILILDKKQKIVLRELSFDEHAEVAGTELLAPVFLAIAEENDEDSEFQGMRKKAQSIEDLCAVIDEDGN